MGKKDFEMILSRLGSNFSCKVSYKSCAYDSNARFAGIIVYHMSDQLTWTTLKGHNARGCYVLIQNIDNIRHGGHELDTVFASLYKYATNMDTTNSACCGGFSVFRGITNYSSIRLNNTNNASCSLPWESDNSTTLSTKEIDIVDKVINEWKLQGINIVVPMQTSSPVPTSVPTTVPVPALPRVPTPPSASASTANCVICQDGNVSVLLYPCRHVCACSNCAPLLRQCPMCRTAIDRQERVFLP